MRIKKYILQLFAKIIARFYGSCNEFPLQRLQEDRSSSLRSSKYLLPVYLFRVSDLSAGYGLCPALKLLQRPPDSLQRQNRIADALHRPFHRTAPCTGPVDDLIGQDIP